MFLSILVIFWIKILPSYEYQHLSLTPTPPMGWNGWNHFRCENANESIIKENADALVSSGMAKAGYEYVIIDDCWQGERNQDGTIRPDSKRFPSGMKAMGDYIHAKGLKFGLYTSAGRKTCEKRPGSYGYEKQDIQSYVEWGVDYLKLDWCDTDNLQPEAEYRKWRQLLDQVNRPMVLSISEFGIDRGWRWGRKYGNLWRMTYDIQDYWPSILRVMDTNAQYLEYVSRGGWNDMDMLQVGNGNMTIAEYRTHFSMWAMMNSSLIAGNDLSMMSQDTKKILTNPGLIAIDQDVHSPGATNVKELQPGVEIWIKPLSSALSYAIAIINRNNKKVEFPLLLSDFGFRFPVLIQNVWIDDIPSIHLESYPISIDPHDTVVLKLWGFKPSHLESTVKTIAVHTGYLSDQEWTFASNGLGPVERNLSNGLGAAKDGTPLELFPNQIYEKGLGIHTYSDIRYNLAGNCQNFTSDIGIDRSVGNKNGRVFFQVYGDEEKLYDSYIVNATDSARSIDLDISGKKELNLMVTPVELSNTAYTQANWANARVVCNESY